LIAEELYQLGINVNCAPLADVLYPDAHDIIGDRAFGETPEQIAVLGRSMAQGLMDGGVIPVLKHIPGHGRALVDSHEALPTVTATRAELETLDFKPFKALADLPMGMTAHIIYTAIDAAHAATVSPKVIELVRRDIGFDGLLFSDDLSMKALTGSFEERTRATLAAGCDVVLHCNGQREEMEAIARANPVMTPAAMQRFVRALKSANHQATTLMADYESRLQQLIQAA
jgi:beta-N-acetylhexosaminidase